MVINKKTGTCLFNRSIHNPDSSFPCRVFDALIWIKKRIEPLNNRRDHRDQCRLHDIFAIGHSTPVQADCDDRVSAEVMNNNDRASDG